MEKKEKRFQKISDTSLAIAQGLDSIGQKEDKHDEVLKLSEELETELDLLLQERGIDEPELVNMCNAFQAVVIMGKASRNTEIYRTKRHYESIAAAICLMSEKFFADYFD